MTFCAQNGSEQNILHTLLIHEMVPADSQLVPRETEKTQKKWSSLTVNNKYSSPVK